MSLDKIIPIDTFEYLTDLSNQLNLKLNKQIQNNLVAIFCDCLEFSRQTGKVQFPSHLYHNRALIDIIFSFSNSSNPYQVLDTITAFYIKKTFERIIFTVGGKQQMREIEKDLSFITQPLNNGRLGLFCYDINKTHLSTYLDGYYLNNISNITYGKNS